MDVYSNPNAEPILYRELKAVTLSTDRLKKQPTPGPHQSMTLFLFLPGKLTEKSETLFFIKFDEAENPSPLVIKWRCSMILQFVPS